MGFRKGFFKNMLVFGGYNYASQLISFTSTIITSRLLTPESFGFVGLITVFTGFILIFSDSGISLAVIRSDYGRSYHKAIDTLALLIGIGLCLFTCLLAYPISLFYKSQALFLPTLVMSLLFIFRSMSLVRGALLSKMMKFNIIGQATLLSNVLQVVLTIILAYYGWDFWALIISQIVASISTLIFYEITTKLGFKIYPMHYVKFAFKYTKKTLSNIMGFNIVNYWARNSDNLLVGRMYGVWNLGIYNRAYNLLLTPLNLITGIIGVVLYPSLKKLKSEGGNIEMEYMFVLKIITVISFPITAALVMFPEQIVLFLWGPAWIKVAELLPYFGLLLFSQSLLSTAGNLLVLSGHEKVLMVSGWVGAIVMVAAIGYGASISVLAVAQYYSLAFILVVLPFNLIYIYIKTLKYHLLTTLMFWVPVIALSSSLWLSCYSDFYVLRISVLGLLLFFVTINLLNDIKTILRKFNKKSSLT